MDRLTGILLVAGIGCFAVAGVFSWLLPVLTLSDLEYTTIEQIAQDPTPEWRDLAERWPDAFKKAFGDEAQAQALILPKTLDESPANPTAVAATLVAYGEALDRGRDIYIGEACWHCHSQYIRGVSREEQRWGPIATADEYSNELYKPSVWGTRRVGPDLSREWGRHTNDWHAAHLYDPASTSPGSIMPGFPWYFEADPEWRPEAEVRAASAGMEEKERLAFLRTELARTPMVPNRDGFALLAYLQWLGSWAPERPWDE